MQITAQMVSQLREQTGAGMMECKKALVATEGDVEQARDLLRAKGKAGAEKRAGRATAEGVVAVGSAGASVALVELNSETDFVARNEMFVALAKALADAAAGSKAETPEALLAEQPAIRHQFDDVLAKLRENIVFRRFTRVEGGDNRIIGTYIHTVTNKTGVLVELEGDASSADNATLARNIAMHIAASKPRFVSREEVPAEAIDHEREVLAELTRNEGKPEAAIPKIVEGRLSKFFEGSCLVDQPYVRDPSTKIGALAKAAGCKVVRFALFLVGQE